MEYRLGRLEDIDKIALLISDAIKEMELNGIHQWDEIYPTKEDNQGRFFCHEERPFVTLRFIVCQKERFRGQRNMPRTKARSGAETKKNKKYAPRESRQRGKKKEKFEKIVKKPVKSVLSCQSKGIVS